MTWQVPTPPVTPPEGPATLELVDDAYLTPVARGEIPALSRPRRWMSGAVYDRTGMLKPASQKVVNGGPWVQVDRDHVAPRPGARRLTGTWIYGGHWMQHLATSS